MGSQIDLAVLAASAALFGVLHGAHTALELLSYRQTEREAEEPAEDGRFMGQLAGDPFYHYLSVGIGRVAMIAVAIVSASRFAAVRLAEGGSFAPGVWLAAAAALLVPLAAAKAAALRNPEKYLERTKLVVYPVVYVMLPAAHLVSAALKKLSPDALDRLAVPVMPFKRRIELFGYQNGTDDTDEQQLVSSVFDFGDTKVREVMVPRIDMVAVNVHANPAEAVDLVVEAGHSRVPVYDDTVDRVVGILHAKDVLARMVAREEFTIRQIMRGVYFVPESKKIGDLLSEFRKRRIHIAIAVDEYGGTAGLVTMEDVLEELVGDIQDEFDAEEELMRRIDDNTALVSARIRLDELNETLGIGLPEGDADTLGGFLYETIGRVPRVGEALASRGFEFKIESIVRQRIDKVLVKGLDPARRKTESPGG